ncbi:MAG: nitrate ABC transporter permease [Bacteroidota bacterium]
MLNQFKKIFVPNARMAQSPYLMLIVVQVVLALGLWMFSKSELLPTPVEIFAALSRLVSEDGLIQELVTSTALSLESMLIATIISLLISYATVMPFFRPLAFLVSKMRFLTLVGLSLVFTLMTSGGHQLKVSLLVFGITVFFVTSMVSVIRSIPKYEFYHARTLGFPEWQVVWEVIILGRFDQVFEVVRQNFAIAWMMLTMVEGISRAEGGIGTMLLNQNKHFHLDAVFAIQLAILTMGILLDWLLGKMKILFCPYANLQLEEEL